MAIKYPEAKRKAEEILEQYALVVPFRLFELSDLMGIKSKECDGEELYEIAKREDPEELNGFSGEDILGYYNNSAKVLYLNKKQTLQRKRFTLAHEIGHHVMHQNSGKNHFRKVFLKKDIVVPVDQTETEANYFAGYLLASDKEIIKRLHYKKIAAGAPTFIRLFATIFGISEEAMRIRFKTFKYENPEIWEEHELSKILF